MFLYNAILCSLATALTFGLLRFYRELNLLLAFLDFAYSLPIGIYFGGISGLLGGIILAFTIKDLTSRRLSILKYRLGSAVLIFMVFYPTICVSTLFFIYNDEAAMLNMFLWLIAIAFCGQYTITKYLRESDGRKQKVKGKYGYVG